MAKELANGSASIIGSLAARIKSLGEEGRKVVITSSSVEIRVMMNPNDEGSIWWVMGTPCVIMIQAEPSLRRHFHTRHLPATLIGGIDACLSAMEGELVEYPGECAIYTSSLDRI